MELSRKKSYILAAASALIAMSVPHLTSAQQTQISKNSIHVNFGSVTTGQSQDVDVKYTPSGCSMVEDSVTISGRDAHDFKIIYNGVTGKEVDEKKSATFKVTVRFTPSHTGPADAEMLANAHAVGHCSLLILVPRDLSGFGVAGQSPLPQQPLVTQAHRTKRAFFHHLYE